MARALPNTSACSANLHNKLPGGAERGSTGSAAAAAAVLPWPSPETPSTPDCQADPVLPGAAAAVGAMPELLLLSAPDRAAESLLLLRLKKPLLLGAAAAGAVLVGLGGLRRSLRTLSRTLSGGKGGAVSSP